VQANEQARPEALVAHLCVPPQLWDGRPAAVEGGLVEGPPWDNKHVNELKELLEKTRADARAVGAVRRAAGRGSQAGYYEPSDAPPRTTRSATKRGRGEGGEGS
jgi:hypothetical protein